MKLPLDVPLESDVEELKKRLFLINEFYPTLKLLDKVENQGWYESIKGAHRLFFLSEFDYVGLSAFSHLRNWKELSDQEIFVVFAQNESLQYPANHVEQLREFLSSGFPFFVKSWIYKIRAKFAALELIASVNPDLGIPLLLKQAIYYLSAKRVVEYIQVNQAYMRSPNLDTRKYAAKQIREITNAIKGDSRKFKNKRYNRYLVYREFIRTADIIKGARIATRENRLNREIFKWFCEEWKLTDELKQNILTGVGSEKELALEVLQHRRLIPEPKAFREFQAKLNKEIKESFHNITAHQFLEFFLITNDLDPTFIYSSSLFEPLNELEINFAEFKTD